MNGVLLVDKPEGPTSHDVVAAARRALRTRRVGHTGTLDPFATGLLVLCVGPSTRLAEYLSGMDKTYEATARLGVTTETLDTEGAPVAETDAWQELDHAAIRAAFEDQRGARQQMPPAFSAKKVAGKRAYTLARAGEAVQLQPVDVTIRALDVLAMDGAHVRFRMRCSAGTYVRAIARDAGETLGVGAHMTALRRTAVGDFDVADAVPLDRLDEPDAAQASLLTPLAAMASFPAVALDAEGVRRVRHGQTLPAGGAGAGVLVLARDGELVAVAECDAESIRPRKVFA